MFFNLGGVVGTVGLIAVYVPLLLLYVVLAVIVSAVTIRYTTQRDYRRKQQQITSLRHTDYYEQILTHRKYAKNFVSMDFKKAYSTNGFPFVSPFVRSSLP